MLTTIADIEAYLGVTLDAGEIAVYTMIIAAIDDYIQGVCDCQFTDAIYSERVSLSCGQVLTRNPAQFVYGLRVGLCDIVYVTTPANSSISIDRDIYGALTLRLIEGLTDSDTDISGMTVQEVIDVINLEAGWAATVVDADYADQLALFLDGEMGQTGDTDEITIRGFMTPVTTSRKTIRTFGTDSCCATGIIVYKGGYATVPADLNDLATRMAILAYTNRDPSTTATGDLKSEEIGDYKYSKLTASEISTSIGDLAVPYQSVIDKYRNFSI